MKRRLTTIGICLLLSCSAVQADQGSTTSTFSKFAKVGGGAVLTAGLGYALWKLYNDVLSDKRYIPTQHYIRDNRGRLTSDTFTAIGLGYLTYKSGLYTLETTKELIETEDDEEEQKT